MIYIVTPCSRPENLEKIYESFYWNIPVYARKHYTWVIVFDLSIGYDNYLGLADKYVKSSVFTMLSQHENAFVGHKHRNFFLDSFENLNYHNPAYYVNDGNENWVYFLDDDTLLHPNFNKYFYHYRNSTKSAFIFHQNNPNGTIRLYADINKVKVNHIDMGQYIINLSKLPKDLRFKEDKYEADGIFIEEIFNRVGPDEFQIIPKVMSTYNQLRAMSIELEQKLHLLNYTKADLLAELEAYPNDYNLLIALGKTTRDISKLNREINSQTKNIIES